MANCDTCARCTYVYEYEAYICTKNDRMPFYDVTSEPICDDYQERVETIFDGTPLKMGDRIPGTALTFIQSVLPRRGEFICDCGRARAFNLSDIERGSVKSCGCKIHWKEKWNESLQQNRI